MVTFNPSTFSPPPLAKDFAVTEVHEPAPDGSKSAWLEGRVEFELARYQEAKVFVKAFTDDSRIGATTYDSATNTFTSNKGADAIGPVSLVSLTGDEPQGYDKDVPYFVAESDGTTFRLSREMSGAPDSFASSGDDLQLCVYQDWREVVTLHPEGMSATFRLPAVKSVSQFRAVTRGRGGASLLFGLHKTAQITVRGDMSPPEPPIPVAPDYDGDVLRFRWRPSPTHGVKGYIIKDQADNFLAENDWSELSYVEEAQGSPVTRRIYAVSSSGVLSSVGAEVTWIKPNTVADMRRVVRGRMPLRLTDALAPPNMLYFSTTQNVLVYKDSGGTIHPLYQ